MSEDKDKAPESKEPEAHTPEVSISKDALLDEDMINKTKQLTSIRAGMQRNF